MSLVAPLSLYVAQFWYRFKWHQGDMDRSDWCISLLQKLLLPPVLKKLNIILGKYFPTYGVFSLYTEGSEKVLEHWGFFMQSHFLFSTAETSCSLWIHWRRDKEMLTISYLKQIRWMQILFVFPVQFMQANMQHTLITYIMIWYSETNGKWMLIPYPEEV